MRDALSGARRFVAFYVFVVLVDAGKRRHMENVPNAVLRLQRRTLDVRSRNLLRH